MKITKEYLRNIIKEEINRLAEYNSQKVVRWGRVIQACITAGQNDLANHIEDAMLKYRKDKNDGITLVDDTLYHSYDQNGIKQPYMKLPREVAREL